VLEYWVMECRIQTHHSITPTLNLLDFRFINVAPAPVLARFKGLDNGVAGCVKVLPRVPIR